MKINKLFKNLILINLFIIVLYTIFFLFIETDSNSSLNESEEMFLSEIILGLIIIIHFILYIVCHYLLYTFKPLGKKLFLPLTLFNIIIYIILIFLSKDAGIYENANSNIDMIVEWLNGLIAGCIIIFLYFTPIKDKFIKQ